MCHAATRFASIIPAGIVRRRQGSPSILTKGPLPNNTATVQRNRLTGTHQTEHGDEAEHTGREIDGAELTRTPKVKWEMTEAVINP